MVEAKDGRKCSQRYNRNFDSAPTACLEVGLRPNVIVVITPRPDLPRDTSTSRRSINGLLKLGGVLDLDGIPRGAARSIRPAAGRHPGRPADGR